VASIIVRGLDESVKTSLAEQGRLHGRSMEAEARAVLTRHAIPGNIGLALLEAARSVGGVEDFEVPERRDEARAVDFE